MRMKLDRATILNLFKLLSFLCLVFVVIVFINIMFNKEMDLSFSDQLKKKQKKNSVEKFDICEERNNKKILFKKFLNMGKICEKNSSIIEKILKYSNFKYFYYTFALVLGGVFNSKNIVKTGIF